MIEVIEWEKKKERGNKKRGLKPKKQARHLNEMHKSAFVPALSHITPSLGTGSILYLYISPESRNFESI